MIYSVCFFFFFKQKTAYEIYQCDWSSDVCSSDLIAVPTGIITVELGRVTQRQVVTRSCTLCGWQEHDKDARYCKRCGTGLAGSETP